MTRAISNSCFTLCLAFACVLCAGAARAAIIEIQPFSFGEWAITSNTGIKYITVQPNGSVSSSPELININQMPQHGIYRVDSLPPFTAVNSVNVSMITPLQGGNQDFTLDNFQVVYDPTSNASGEITISLGATAKTTGTGIPYDDDTYGGTLQLDINY